MVFLGRDIRLNKMAFLKMRKIFRQFEIVTFLLPINGLDRGPSYLLYAGHDVST